MLRSMVNIAIGVPVVSCKVCTSVYRCTRFDERCGAMAMARARMKHNPAKRGLGRVGWLSVSCSVRAGPPSVEQVAEVCAIDYAISRKTRWALRALRFYCDGV